MSRSTVTRSATADHHRARAVAWLLAGVGLVAICIVAAEAVVSAPPDVTLDMLLGDLALVGAVVAFLLSGAIIASRQPGNVIGWLLIVPGLAIPIGQAASTWLAGLDPPPTTVDPVLWLLLWSSGWSWIALIFPIFHLLLTFPDGRLLSRRWRAVVALEIVMIGVFVGFATFMTELGVLVDDESVWTVANPIGFIPVSFFDDVVSGPWGVGLLSLTILSVSAVMLRFRRGSADERQQLKWPLAAIAFFGAVYAAGALTTGADQFPLWGLLFSLSIASIPIAVAIAVLRYRLYEIDRIISRTLGWAIVTGLLVAVFALLVVGLQGALAGFTQGQTLAVAASTLVAFALFAPVRRRVQRAVDRRFDRARYDAERTATAFAERLRDVTDIATVTDDLAATTAAALAPVGLGIWLRETGR